MSNPAASRPPMLYILSAPSGGGKSSLARALADRSENIVTSVSHTTRPQRPGETDGVDYFFVDPAQFEQMIKDDGFLEHAAANEHFEFFWMPGARNCQVKRNNRTEEPARPQGRVSYTRDKILGENKTRRTARQPYKTTAALKKKMYI